MHASISLKKIDQNFPQKLTKIFPQKSHKIFQKIPQIVTKLFAMLRTFVYSSWTKYVTLREYRSYPVNTHTKITNVKD